VTGTIDTRVRAWHADDDEDMRGSARVVTRGRLNMLIGTLLLAGALIALCLPVFLDAYDRWGVQIKMRHRLPQPVAAGDDQ